MGPSHGLQESLQDDTEWDLAGEKLYPLEPCWGKSVSLRTEKYTAGFDTLYMCVKPCRVKCVHILLYMDCRRRPCRIGQSWFFLGMDGYGF